MPMRTSVTGQVERFASNREDAADSYIPSGMLLANEIDFAM
jgi:hypothetical protein